MEMEGSWRFHHKTQDFASRTAAHLFILIGYLQQVMHETFVVMKNIFFFPFTRMVFILTNLCLLDKNKCVNNCQ